MRELDPPIRSQQIYAGKIVNLRVSDYRRPSGIEVRREVMDHNGGVVMVPVEDDRVLMVRQPRDAIREALLELPAGKLEPGEAPLDCAIRELGEEVAREAGDWLDLGGFYTAPAILTEFIHCFMARDLRPADVAPVPGEEVEVVPWPLADLDALIAQVHDAKSLIGLLRLARLTTPPPPGRLRRRAG